MTKCMNPVGLCGVVLTTTLMAMIVPSCRPSEVVRPTPPEYNPSDQTKCKIAKSQQRPLIVEWPGADRTDLSAFLREERLVAVRYDGCQMELIRGCKLPGKYRWVSTPREQESILMNDADELYAQMPMAGPSLEGHLKRGSSLRVSTTIVGKYVADRPGVSWEEVSAGGGDCLKATHAVIGLTAGAFQLAAEAHGSAGVNAGFVGGKSSGSQQSLKSAGSEDSCSSSKSADSSPPENCRSPLRIEVEPIKCPIGYEFEVGKGCHTHQHDDKSKPNPTPQPAPGPVVYSGDRRDADFAQFMRDMGRALLATAMGKPHDPRWDCPDSVSKRDLRSYKKPPLTELGSTPDVVMNILNMELQAPSGSDKRVTLESIAFVLKDGSVRWTGSFDASVRSGIPGGSDSTLLSVAPFGVGRALEHFVDDLAPGKCAPRLLTISDISTLPLSDKMRERSARDFGGAAKNVPAACKAVGQARRPWQFKPQQALAIAVGKGKMMGLLAKMAISDQGQGLCLYDFEAQSPSED